ncbi:hypothetical protein SDJN02_06510, partial [Cucurbita argyrosperma subsp. argyrosperma]
MEDVGKDQRCLTRVVVSSPIYHHIWAKEPKGKKAADTVLISSFRYSVVHSLKTPRLLVFVLRLVDGDKPTMLPYSVCNNLEKLGRDLLQKEIEEGKGAHLVSWEVVGKLVNLGETAMMQSFLKQSAMGVAQKNSSSFIKIPKFFNSPILAYIAHILLRGSIHDPVSGQKDHSPNMKGEKENIEL